MKKRNNPALIYLSLFCISVLSCNIKADYHGCTENNQVITINHSDYSFDSVLANRFNKLVSSINEMTLPGDSSLLNDDFSIQFFWWYRGYSKNRMLTIHRRGKEINCNLVLFKARYSDSSDTLYLNTWQRKQLVPVSGWDVFEDSLHSSGIFELTGFDKLTGYEVPMDSETWMVRLQTASYARSYEFPEPEMNSSKFAEAQTILMISDFLQRQFSVANISCN